VALGAASRRRRPTSPHHPDQPGQSEV